MSLLKANKFKVDGTTYAGYRESFLGIIATSGGSYTREDLKYLIGIYCNLSAKYIKDISTTLVDPEGVQTSMKYMNSYIAEVTNQLQLPYYHPEEGYTVIDKALQYVLDAGEPLIKTEYIEDIIKDFEDTAQKMKEADIEEDETEEA